jgi:hypothetical protein
MFQVLFGRLLANALGATLVVLDPSEGSGRGKGSAKRSAGAAAILVALFPNLRARLESNVTNSSAAHGCLAALRSPTEGAAVGLPFAVGRITDIDRLWRQWGQPPGPSGRLAQFHSPWAFGAAGAACVLVDGYFQATALYERRRAYVAWLLHVDTAASPSYPPPIEPTAADGGQPRASRRAAAAAAARASWLHHPLLGPSPLRPPGPRDAVVHLRTCEANRGAASDLK